MAERGTWFKEFWRNNRSAKLVALVLAAFTFYALRGVTGREKEYTIPVEVEVGKGIAILGQEPRTVDVTFRGSQEDLLQLDPKEIKAVIRPKAIDPAGSETVRIHTRDVEGAPRVRVTAFKPPYVALTFDREAEKTVPVTRPKVIGRPLMGQVDIEYEPQVVKIRGPTKRLKDKEVVFTEPVDVEGAVESFTRKVRVLPPSDTWVSQIEPAEITVKVKIVTESGSRDWTNAPVLLLAEPGTYRALQCDPAQVHLSLHGRQELLDQLDERAVYVFVDCSGIEQAARRELPVNVHFPPKLDLTATVEPPTVRVTFEKE